MAGLALATVLFASHGGSAYDWHISCDRFLELRLEVQFDQNLDTRSKYKLIQYFKSKVDGECNATLL